jgi:hypothetical protein
VKNIYLVFLLIITICSNCTVFTIDKSNETDSNDYVKFSKDVCNEELKGSFELLSVERIWDFSPYCAMGDLIRFKNEWICCFTERSTHMPFPGTEDNGKLRVIGSKNLKKWESKALIEEKDIDLRDPHLSVTPDGHLMMVAGGSRYPDGFYKGRQSRVMFSENGSVWTKPQPLFLDGHWLWQVTWHNGKAFSVSKCSSTITTLPTPAQRQQFLLTSEDGIHWEEITELKVPSGDETAIRFYPDGKMILLMRRQGEGWPTYEDNLAGDAVIGSSNPPYKEWNWHKTKHFIGGPNFIILPDGKMIGGGRTYRIDKIYFPTVSIGFMNEYSFEPKLNLPSSTGNGEQGYPGFVYDEGILYCAYYSAHEKIGKPEIFLAKIRVKND